MCYVFHPTNFTFSDEIQQLFTSENYKIYIQLLFPNPYIPTFSMDTEPDTNIIIIGYYPFRAKAQLCRLLCEFLHINYQDKFYTPDQWSKFKEEQAKNWVIKELPYLEHQDFHVTGTSAMIYYITQIAERPDLLGKTIQDKIKMDSIRSKFDLRDAMLGLVCTNRPTCPLEQKKCMSYYWEKKILPLLSDYENECLPNNWYFGYLTVLDFAIYQILFHIQKIFPNELSRFPKLSALRARVGNLPQIKNYEQSQRAVVQYCPVRYFSQFKQQKIKANKTSSSASSTSSNRSSQKQMDIQ